MNIIVAWLLTVLLALAGCATVPREVPRPASHAWSYPESTPLGQVFARQLIGHPGESGFYLLDSGIEAFSIRGVLADGAQHTLDLQYYMVRDDMTTALLLYRVLRAAQRGVRVRLLVDDLYAAGKDFNLARFSAHPNVEVRVFNPFMHRGPLGLSQLFEFLGDSTRLNRRMHNKLWIADNAAAIVGGRNLGDEYFDAGENTNFTDLDALATGPVVQALSHSFDAYWSSSLAVPVEAFVEATPTVEQRAAFEADLAQRAEDFRDSAYAGALRESHLGRRLRGGDLPLTVASAIALYDPPAKGDGADDAEHHEAFRASVRPLLEGARRSVLLISPYFIPGAEGVKRYTSLAERGVQVRVLTNSLASTDTPVVHAGYAGVRVALVGGGVELYEIRPEARVARRPLLLGASSGASLHAKALVIDQRYVLLGSMNMDPRSRTLNTEVGVLVDSPPLAEQVSALSDEAVKPANAFRVTLTAPGSGSLVWITEEDREEVRYRHEPLAGFWRRLIASLAKVFAPAGAL